MDITVTFKTLSSCVRSRTLVCVVGCWGNCWQNNLLLLPFFYQGAKDLVGGRLISHWILRNKPFHLKEIRRLVV